MDKAAMLFALVVSFCYAVWLVLWRRTPDLSGGIAGRRGLLIFLTLYFMQCLGADVLAGEREARSGPATRIAADADDGVGFYDSFLSAWIALGHMVRLDMLAYAGEPEVRDAYRKARARKDDAATLELRQKHSEKTRTLRERQFADLMTKAADSGRVGGRASALLIALYSRLNYHYYRLHTTCYVSTPLRREVRTPDSLHSIEGKIRELANGATPNSRNRDELADDLGQMQRHLIESAEAWMLQSEEDGRVEAYEMNKRKLEELEKNLCGPEEYRQAADILIEIAPRLPEDWGRSFE